ncbi:hypothetical protein TNCV_1361411 [Trichonephila clavipes]|nr:hypothetical protein TNCV_1361411 [Trichonephila clavipes]
MSPNSNPTIVMWPAETGFVSKLNVIPFPFPCPPLIAPLVARTPVVYSQGLTKQWMPCTHSTLLQTRRMILVDIE